jgi:hypothetical protein
MSKDVEDDTSEAYDADHAFKEIIEEKEDGSAVVEAFYFEAAINDIDAAENEKALE